MINNSTGNKSCFLSIPPRCEKIFTLDTRFDEDCVILPCQLCDGVFIARSIIL